MHNFIKKLYEIDNLDSLGAQLKISLAHHRSILLTTEASALPLTVLGLYMVPALLYCLYNNLAFVNLAAFDPTTYFMLLQLRVVVTGIVFQVQ